METATEQEPKERIIKHAEERFLASGFNKVTLDELSSELGISKKTMYKFFPSKDDLLKTIIRALQRRVERNIINIVESDKPIVQKLAEFMLFIGTMASRFSRAFQMDVQRFAPGLWKEMDTFRKEKITTYFGALIQEAKQEKVFRSDVNDQVVFMMFLNSVQSIVNPEVLSQNSFSPKEAMYTIFHVILEGSFTEEARKEFINYEINSL